MKFYSSDAKVRDYFIKEGVVVKFPVVVDNIITLRAFTGEGEAFAYDIYDNLNTGSWKQVIKTVVEDLMPYVKTLEGWYKSLWAGVAPFNRKHFFEGLTALEEGVYNRYVEDWQYGEMKRAIGDGSVLVLLNASGDKELATLACFDDVKITARNAGLQFKVRISDQACEDSDLKDLTQKTPLCALRGGWPDKEVTGGAHHVV